MRCLFLDFDGVLHPVDAVADWREFGVNGSNIEHYARERDLFRWLPELATALHEHPDVVIAVHSGWRSLASNTQIRSLLGDLAERFIGVTSLTLRRHDGIQEMAARAEVTHMLIVDDATHEFPIDCEELLLTHPLRGLAEPEMLQRLTAWLESTSPDRTPRGLPRQAAR